MDLKSTIKNCLEGHNGRYEVSGGRINELDGHVDRDYASWRTERKKRIKKNEQSTIEKWSII